MFYQHPRGVFRCRPLDRHDWLLHGFGSRHSGSWLPASRVASLNQIHSTKSIVVRSAEGCAGEGDGLLTAEPGQIVAVRTADCLPILMVAPAARVVAAVHAGWRGSAENIAGAVVERFRRDFQVYPEKLEVAIGPGIGGCCYEVGEEVAKRFRDLLPGLPARGKAMLDLVEVNRRQLVAAGVVADRVYRGAPCTACWIDVFYSYRRQPGEQGRMVSAVGILPETHTDDASRNTLGAGSGTRAQQNDNRRSVT